MGLNATSVRTDRQAAESICGRKFFVAVFVCKEIA
jgi:hypothetical protein